MRWRKRLPAQFERARALIHEISAYADYQDARPMSAEYLKQLREHIDYDMRQKGIKVVR